MAKVSAGLLVFRKNSGTTEVLLAHPGGPFWAKKDSWSIPKGEVENGEALLQAARREFKEETGLELTGEDYLELGETKQAGGKINHIWAIEANLDITKFSCKSYAEVEWPPKSGNIEQFPEVDRVAWYSLVKARQKLFKYQVEFIERLADKVGEQLDEAVPAKKPEQTSLL